MVDKALGIMDVAITGSAPSTFGVGRVGEVDENKAGSTLICAWRSTNRDNVVGSFGVDKVVSAANGEV